MHFNPASLLSFGDGLAFVNTQGPELVSSPTHGPGSMARLAAPENAPKMAEQMAVNADLTARIPQKYLIQNQSGLRVYYWAESVSVVQTALTYPAGHNSMTLSACIHGSLRVLTLHRFSRICSSGCSVMSVAEALHDPNEHVLHLHQLLMQRMAHQR